MSINVVVTGDEELIRKLSKLESQLTDWSAALKEIGRFLVDFYSDNVFASQGGALAGSKGITGGQGEGVPWLKLAPSTIAYKAKHYSQYASVPLMATGEMKNSFYYDAGRNLLEIGNTSDHFEFHQGNGDRTKLPRRPMLGINNSVKSIIKQTLEADIRKKVRAL